ncbi:MAG TPA: tyrosine-type recombinase/integrase [Methanosphaera sp.]|nr:tyrosine-type recombinase/integrase [Methanosphaera sp.]
MNVRPDIDDPDYVFLTNNEPSRCHDELRTHNYIVTKYMDKAGIDYSTRHHGFHSLRHSTATRMIEENIDIYTVQTVMGHESPNTTMVYIGSDLKNLKDCALEII